MKNLIVKLVAVVGIVLAFFCTAAGSMNSTDGIAPTFSNAPSRVSALPSFGSASSMRLPARTKETPRPEWTAQAFADDTPPVKTAAEERSFSKTVNESFTPSYKYSDEEKAYIARVVYAEARGEVFEGKVAVAAVVLKRFESGLFGKTVKKVVLAKNQFAVARKYSSECMKAVEEAIEKNEDYPDDLYYFRVSKSKKWRNFDYYDRIGNHSFYCS